MINSINNSFESLDGFKIQQETLSICHEIAGRLSDVGKISTFFTSTYKVPSKLTSLSTGYPGIVLLFAELDRQEPNRGWDHVVFDYISALKSQIDIHGVGNISLYSGLAGINYSIFNASHERKRYQKLLSVLDTILVNQILKFMNELKKRKNTFEAAYDVISGLSGIGRYLLTDNKNVEFIKTLRILLTYLVDLTQQIKVKEYIVPGWYIDNESLHSEKERKLYPNGYFNCGLSHGIPGPLSLLSIALKWGIEVEGQREAIRTIANWLIEKKREDEYGIYWPFKISFKEEVHGITEYSKTTKDAWCYGAPGVCRSLFLAGEALENQDFCKTGINGFESIFKRPFEELNIPSPTVCHGISGLLQVTVRMAESTGLRNFQEYKVKLINHLIQSYNYSFPFLFQDLEPTIEGYKGVNKPGYLEGASGIALSLLTLNSLVNPIWDQTLLIT
ncbi:lanthionine synthetase-like protein [Brevibacillus sp. AG162]|uniref:lanthionine synthetase C family protein n=1 Tax=Brevibacillus sp. AG162 TaxID=2572910 RepID=UPI00114DBAD2|nr:lanthionine synthetase C family protein [Brevibacillus sp. AG162]TQK53513.1 lanthionine synthetase-like protein [Brevibacillus sp. AG162]